ncbi:MAG: hypothetical protein AB8G14_19065 [Ilumatobacter sp.]
MSELVSTLVRAAAMAVLVSCSVVLGASPAQADRVQSSVWVSAATHAAQAGVEQVDDEFDLNQNRSDRSAAPLIGIGVMVAILVFGLKAIKKQRDEGRRSKLPPIG